MPVLSHLTYLNSGIPRNCLPRVRTSIHCACLPHLPFAPNPADPTSHAPALLLLHPSYLKVPYLPILTLPNPTLSFPSSVIVSVSGWSTNTFPFPFTYSHSTLLPRPQEHIIALLRQASGQSATQRTQCIIIPGQAIYCIVRAGQAKIPCWSALDCPRHPSSASPSALALQNHRGGLGAVGAVGGASDLHLVKSGSRVKDSNGVSVG